MEHINAFKMYSILNLKTIHYIYVWRIGVDVVFLFFCFFTLPKRIMNMYYFKIRKSKFHMEKNTLLVIGFNYYEK